MSDKLLEVALFERLAQIDVFALPLGGGGVTSVFPWDEA